MADELVFDLTPEELDVFCIEAEEILETLDAELLAIEQGADLGEVVQRLFRSAHTLKGSAGAIGHQRMTELAHSMEAVLELLRQRKLTVSPELIDLLLQCSDALKALVGEVSSGRRGPIEVGELVAQLKLFVQDMPALGKQREAVLPHQGQTDSLEVVPALGETSGTKHLRVIITGDCIAPAARALQVLMALETAGAIERSIPSREAVERGEEHRQIEVWIRTALSDEELQRLLQRVGDLEKVECVNDTEFRPAGVRQNASLVSTAAVSKGGGHKTVRTSVERLDKLMTLVGELVTDRNRLMQMHIRLSSRFEGADFLTDLAQSISHLAAITDELQDEVMRARMLPLDNVFSKFPRMVRDLAREAGKNITFLVEGQETELDRSVIEEIADPLLHLLRNAVDHGVETPAERERAGKPAEAIIRLAAKSEGDRIIITVADDGRGINPDKLRAAAVKKGFISEDQAARLSDTEALELMFLPGLSTADKVTDVSGRGVGMDVVRTNIQRLHGSVNVRSELGKGTTFELSLPLTLAIMPVLLVGLGEGLYCIPLTSVIEVLEVEPRTIHRVDRGELVLWRNRQLPLIRLNTFYGLPRNGNGHYRGEKDSVVAVRHGDTTFGLVVETLHGQQEIVIKSLGDVIGQVPGISGSTILGDGTVALIVDVPGLAKQAARGGASQLVRRN